VFAVVGPTGDATALAALPVHEEAGLPMVLIAPGHSSLATEALLLEDSAVLLHARPADMYLAVALVTHLGEHTRAARPAILQDRSLGHHSDTLGTAVHMVAPHYAHLAPVARVVPAGTSQHEGLGPVVAGLLDEGADAFVYIGSPGGAAAVARELSAAGFQGPRIALQPVLVPQFLEEAGEAAEGWLVIAACTEAAAVPAAAEFTAAYRAEHDAEPGHFALEAYDAARLVLDALPDAGADADGPGPGRAGLAARLREAGHQGLAKEYAFDPETGEFAAAGLFLHQVGDGRFSLVGPAPAPAAPLIETAAASP
jgi:eukaryotic-like serine/threonine-protein kinase